MNIDKVIGLCFNTRIMPHPLRAINAGLHAPWGEKAQAAGAAWAGNLPQRRGLQFVDTPLMDLPSAELTPTEQLSAVGMSNVMSRIATNLWEGGRPDTFGRNDFIYSVTASEDGTEWGHSGSTTIEYKLRVIHNSGRSATLHFDYGGQHGMVGGVELSAEQDAVLLRLKREQRRKLREASL